MDKYYYLSKKNILNKKIVIYKQTYEKLSLNDEIYTKYDDIIEYATNKGKNIPNNWEYSEDINSIYDMDEAPSKFHKFIKGEWILNDISGYKKYIRDKLKLFREKAISEDILYNGNYYQVRNQIDLNNLNDALNLMTSEDVISWITSNNDVVILTKLDIKNIYDSYKFRKEEIFKEYIKELNILEQTNDYEVLKNIGDMYDKKNSI